MTVTVSYITGYTTESLTLLLYLGLVIEDSNKSCCCIPT
nr:MAG TPA: hypothetical protein [Caudoviricetes sp.]